MGIDGDAVREVQPGHPARVASRQPGRPAVRRVDVEPQALAARERGEALDPVDRARVGGARDRADRDRCGARRPVARDGLGDGLRVEAEPLVGREGHEGLGREAELVQGPGDREVRLVAGVDPDAVQVAAARGPFQPANAAQVDVPDQRHRDEVRHHAARGAQPERAVAVADEVVQPAHDLLLDEGAAGSGVPDVDALVRPLGEDLAGDRGDQRRRGEVRQGARVVRVEGVGRDPGRELVEDRLERDGVGGGGARRERLAEVDPAQLRVAGDLPEGAGHRLVVQPVESWRPRSPDRPARARRGTPRRRGCRSAPARDASGTGRGGRRPSPVMVGPSVAVAGPAQSCLTRLVRLPGALPTVDWSRGAQRTAGGSNLLDLGSRAQRGPR